MADRRALERAIARALKQDPDAPGYDAELQRWRVTAPDERRMREARSTDWHADAYRTYMHLLALGALPTKCVEYVPHVDIPEAIALLPPVQQPRLPAWLVARWAFQHRRLGKTYDQIAVAMSTPRPAPARLAMLHERLHAARAAGDHEEAVRLTALIALVKTLRWKDDHARSRSDDAVRHRVREHALIWETAERNHGV